MKRTALALLSICTVAFAAVALLPTQASCVPDNGSPMQMPPPSKPNIASGGLVDVAPFGEARKWNDKSFGLIWEDARDIVKVVVAFADGHTLPDPASVKLQYWKGGWPQERAPRDKLVGSGGSGWMDAGDWYNGKWRDADTKIATDGNTWTLTFEPINKAEYTDLGDFDANYRTTMKLRLVFSDTAPSPASIQAYTDSTWQAGSLIVEWGGTATNGEQVWDGKVEAYNGYVTNVRALAGSKLRLSPDQSWTSSVSKTTDGIVLDVLYAKPIAVSSFDETIVTVRAKQHSFSFCPREVADGKRVFIRDFGVLVKGPRDSTGFDEAEAAYQKAPKDIYRRVLDMPEQTLTGAWSAMPTKGRIYMPLSVNGGRQHFRLTPNGDIAMRSNWLRSRRSTDSEQFVGEEVRINFGLPQDGTTGAHIEDDILPIATTWYEKDGVRYSQEAFATTLTGKLPVKGQIPAEEPLVAMVKLTITNNTDAPKNVALPMNCQGETPVVRDDLIYTNVDNRELLRLMVDPNSAAKLSVDGKNVIFSVDLPAKGTRQYYVKIPFLVLNPEQTSDLKKLKYDAQRKLVANHWRKLYARSSQIDTPEPMIDAFYAANASHQLINSESEIGNTGRLMAKVGTFGYGVYSNESVMMASEMDRRGYHDEAERIYQTWIHYQGTSPLPGDYTTHEGEFYGANHYEHGGYNQHHGWVLWGLGEHYWFTRDKAWLTRVAPNIVKGCDWITKQRVRTKTDECRGLRAIEYGLLPPGSLEDIGDWRSWQSNNVFSWWGMDNTARALCDIGHPEGPRLLKEAQDYAKDIRTAFFEAMVRSPVVALRDGTHIPNIPADVHRRGRSFGWITETLEGSIHLVRCGLIGPDEPAARWIMQDYEDNRYLSEQFGYQAKDFEKEWFGIGGFSQQPSLLCSPTPYIIRDEPEHYLRAYFNAFAAGYFPERQMLTEHPLPNLGDYRGDHFKSSDEAMNTSWLRWIFVWDEGDSLYLSKAMPRYWLDDGKTVKIDRTATHFGPMSMSMVSRAKSGRIEMTIDPPTRNEPKAIYARFRHPQGKKMTRATVNGKKWDKIDPEKEWVILPALKSKTVVVAYYD